MNMRLDSTAPGLAPDGEASVLCVHFAADGREHSMWYLDPEDTRGPGLSGFTAGLTCDWTVSPSGVARAAVLRHGRHLLCDALLLRPGDADSFSSSIETAGGTFGSLLAWDARRKDNGLLRAEGVASYPAATLAGVRHRPLLATFARRVDLPAAMARHVHGLLLRTAPGDGRCRKCAGTGSVRGEPCLACS